MTAPLVMFCTNDLAGQTRGKGVPAADLEARIAQGVGWTPTNSMITCFGQIAPSPWGPFGDLVLAPDALARFDVTVDGDIAETVFLADIETPDGAPWPVCPRGFAKRMLGELEMRHGLKLRAAFEHEFMIADGVPGLSHGSYALADVSRRRPLLEAYLNALEAARLNPESLMAEYGPNQYEVVVGPAEGVAIADRAIAVREIGRAVARRHEARMSFAPIADAAGVGTGAHLHFGLIDAKSGKPHNYDPDGSAEMSGQAASFVAGILNKLPSILALTAASAVSYLRLSPNRWSATHANLGIRDREAAVRICPTFERTGKPVADQFHFEFRAADCAASPYLVLGAVVAAGLYGLNARLPAPKPLDGAPSAASEAELQAAGVRPLPHSLDDALDCLEVDSDIAAFLGAELHGAYLAHKRFEASLVADLDDQTRCDRYFEVY